MCPIEILSEKAIIRKLKRFIRHNTVSSLGNLAMAAEVSRALQKGGFRVRYQKKRSNGRSFANVIGIKGRGKKALLLCAHMDTVPPGEAAKWTRTRGKPRQARYEKGRLYGLGSADDKGPLLAAILAGSSVDSHLLKKPLMLLATFGEESGMGGALLFTRRWKGPKPRFAFVAEPTSLGITYRHKGIGALVIELHSERVVPRSAGLRKKTCRFKGKQAHSSRPWLGVNALEKAIQFLRSSAASKRDAYVLSLEGGSAANLIPERAATSLAEFPEPLRRKKTGQRGCPIFPARLIADCVQAVWDLVEKMSQQKDSSFRPPVMTSNLGVARTRRKNLSLTFDFRLLPGQSLKRIRAELQLKLEQLVKLYPGIRARIGVERDNPPLGLEPNDPVVRLAKALLVKNGLAASLSTKPSCTEAGIYAGWGVPSIVFGPGKATGNIHAPNEYISITQIRKAIRFYRSFILETCGRKPCS